MELFYFTFLLCICRQHVVSQSSQNVQRNTNQQASLINQDQIYFADNRPSSAKTQIDVQKSFEPQNIPQDSYSQAALGIQNYGPFKVEAGSQNSDSGNRDLPSQSILPPKYDTFSQNYYSMYGDKDDIVTRKGENVPNKILTEIKVSNTSRAIANFGINLLKNVNNQGRNLVVSPFSIAELLSLLQQGALGETQQQISEALQMTPQVSLEAFKMINEKFQKRNSRNILRIANSLFVADAFELSPAFKRVAIQSFGSEVTPIRFTQNQEAVQKINNWVAQKTNNKIPELLTADAVSDNTQVMMVNAVYFKGLWAIKFKPESTLPRDFYVNDVSKKRIPFMRIRKIFRAGVDSSNNAQVIILPFESEQFSLMVIVPSTVSTLDALVSTLTPTQLASYFTFTPKEVDLEIPKFTARADTDLNSVLRKLGIMNIFGQKSELSGLGMYRSFSPQISSALHSAMLSIDEEGGSAAAATSFAVVALSYDEPSVVIKANRPFFTVLWDNESLLPLFMARIQDPTF